MPLPAASTPVSCPRCSSTQVRMSASGASTAVRCECACGHRFDHPNQAFARDLARGRERIVVRRIA